MVLGLIQGLTEFLPVSSSGHLTIFKAIFGIEADNLSFEVAVHAATVLSTIVAFRKEIWDIICGVFKFKYNSQTQYFLKICVSMIPVAVVGFFFKDQVEGFCLRPCFFLCPRPFPTGRHARPLPKDASLERRWGTRRHSS